MGIAMLQALDKITSPRAHSSDTDAKRSDMFWRTCSYYKGSAMAQ